MTSKSVVVSCPDRLTSRRLAKQINSASDFHVVAQAYDLTSTFADLEDHLPNAVLIAESLVALPEFEVMRALFSALDVRWLVIRNATKPEKLGSSQPAGADLFTLAEDTTTETLISQLLAVTRGVTKQAPVATPPDAPIDTGPYERLILIGASTGGVDALLTVLSRFPPDCPPTLIVQHTGAGFGASLADLLNRQCKPTVKLATGRQPLKRGHVVVGAGVGAHLTLTSDRPLQAVLETGPAVSGHCPSVDRLFESAVPVAHRSVATVLTGMGRDGARGLLALKSAGARTFAQDEKSSVVFGMPRAALETGAAEIALPVSQIGDAMLAAARADVSHALRKPA